MAATPSPPVALVTGWSSAIGRACADRLAADGHTVVAGCHTTAPDDHHPHVRFDATDPDQVEAAFTTVAERWGPPAVVVHAVGRSHLDLVLRMPPERFRTTVDVDLTAAFLVTRAALRTMVPARHGRIVLVGSVGGLVGVPGSSAYAAAKAGLGGFARSVAREVGRRGVTVNVVAPGVLDDAVERLDAWPASQPAHAAWMARTPAGRAGRPEEVAAVVAYLASSRAGAVTGATIAVDGGHLLAPSG